VQISEIYSHIETLESIQKKEELILAELKAKRYDNDFMDMEPFLFMLLEWEDKLSDELSLAYVYDGLSAINFYKDQYDTSLEYGFKALEIADRKMDTYLSAVCLHLIGLIYFRMENTELAEKYFLRSAHLCPTFPNVLCNLGLLYYEQGDIEKSQYYITEGVTTSQAHQDKTISGMGLFYKAIFEHCNNEYLKAIEYLDKALVLVETKNDTYLLMSILIEKARVFHKLKDNQKAKEILNEAIGISNRFSRLSLLSRAYYQLARICKDDGDYKSAYEHLKSASNYENITKTKDKTTRLSEIQSEYELINTNQGMVQLINQNPRLTSIGIVSSGIVHEIKQPLSAIKISCESILYWYKRNLGAIPDIVIEQLKDISVSVNHVNKIIEQIRSFWKTESLTRAIERVELNEFLTEKIDTNKNRLQSKDVFIELVPSDTKLFSDIDKNCFEQIILYVINICFIILSERSTDQEQKIKIELKHNLDFNTLTIHLNQILDLPLAQILSKASSNDNLSSLLLDLEISKYFLNQYNGYITFNDEPTPHFLVAIPGEIG